MKIKGNCGRETQKVPQGKIHHGFKEPLERREMVGRAHAGLTAPLSLPVASLGIYIMVFLQQPPKDYSCDLCDGAKVPQCLV